MGNKGQPRHGVTIGIKDLECDTSAKVGSISVRDIGISLICEGPVDKSVTSWFKSCCVHPGNLFSERHCFETGIDNLNLKVRSSGTHLEAVEGKCDACTDVVIVKSELVFGDSFSSNDELAWTVVVNQAEERTRKTNKFGNNWTTALVISCNCEVV